MMNQEPITDTHLTLPVEPGAHHLEKSNQLIIQVSVDEASRKTLLGKVKNAYLLLEPLSRERCLDELVDGKKYLITMQEGKGSIMQAVRIVCYRSEDKTFQPCDKEKEDPWLHHLLKVEEMVLSANDPRIGRIFRLIAKGLCFT